MQKVHPDELGSPTFYSAARTQAPCHACHFSTQTSRHVVCFEQAEVGLDRYIRYPQIHISSKGPAECLVACHGAEKINRAPLIPLGIPLQKGTAPMWDGISFLADKVSWVTLDQLLVSPHRAQLGPGGCLHR